MNTMPLALLNTDILSALMRKNPLAVKRARSYLKVHQQFTFSIITRYEILRGLLAKGATKQIAAFNKLCIINLILPLNDSVIVQAATIYSELYRRGELISDADILIAATAIKQGLAVVTNNENHFRRIPDLRIENWLA
jgi:tRNA(fMet)-specific endonuclease VapC